MFSVPTTLFAASEKEVKKQSVEISGKIDLALDQVNEKYQELEQLKQDVSETEETIKLTEEKIKATQKSIDTRKETMAARMQDMQENGQSMSVLDSLLSSESVSDFISRAYAISVLQGAERTKVDTLSTDKEKLEALKKDLETSKESLSTQQTAMETEQANLSDQVADLKDQLASNEAVLTQLSNEKIIQEAKKQKEVADRKKREEQASKPVVTEQVVKEEKTEETKPSTPKEEPTPSTPEPTTPPASNNNNNNSGNSTGGGRVLTMESTAYSYTEAGLTPFTATGIDLRQNSRVIAVDPNVIPLNSLVEVSGYGFAVAGDTGGAIKGNIIDVHFNTVDECINWGRRMVTVTIQ